MRHMESQHSASLILFKPITYHDEVMTLQQKVKELELALQATQEALIEQTTRAEGFAIDLEHLLNLMPRQS